jgi:transcriptional regulator with XRE-family HTH domain
METQVLSTLGKKIRAIRVSKNLLQAELAAQCGFEKASMSRIESGKTNVSVLTLARISKALNVEIGEFFLNGSK